MRKSWFLILIFLCSMVLNSFALNLENIPSEILEQASQNPALVQKYLNENTDKSIKSDDKNLEIEEKVDGKTFELDNNTVEIRENEQAELRKEKELVTFNSSLNKFIDYESYSLKSGDILIYSLYDRNGLVGKYNIKVVSDSIYLPKIGDFYLKNYLSLKDFIEAVSIKLKAKNMYIQIEEIKPAEISIGVFGAIKKPGFYTISRLDGILGLLGKVGALDKENIKNIYIYRNDLMHKKINFNEFLSGKISNYELLNNDIIVFESVDVKADKKRKFIEDFDKLKVFGASLFDSETNNYPDQNVNVDDDYIVGAGDVLNIYLWGRITKNYSLSVQSDGSIFIKEIGKIQVGGKKLAEVKKIIKGYINSIEGVEGDVAVSSLKTIRVLVVGEVKKPGFQTINNLSTVTTVIAKAGGITKYADLRNVYVKRKNKIIATIDYYDFILKGDTSKDIYLQPNDIVFVPKSKNIVYLAGSVKKPAIYMLKTGESLTSLIKYAGGLLPNGFSKVIHVKRFYNDKPAELFDISLDKANSFILSDGDQVLVTNIEKPEKDSVYLYGEVYFPGRFSLKNYKSLKALIGNIDNIKPEASLDYGYIKRVDNENKERVIIPFSVRDVLKGKKDIELKPLDEVYIVNKYDVEPKNIVEINGEVQRPGKYEVEEKISLFDIIKKAGGLTTDAAKNYIEIIRKNDGKFLTRFVSIDKSKDFYVLKDDKIIVHSIWEKNLKKYVEIKGEIKNPGKYLLTEGMTVNDLIIKAGGLTKDVFLDKFHIYRLNESDFNYQLFTLNLKKDLNFVLKDRDEVVIHNFREFHPVKTVQIYGEVNNPGIYKYAENMTVKDLIIAAGNLKESAYLDRAEIVRMFVEKGKTVYDVIDVNLNDVLSGKINVLLKPYDVLKIKRISDFKKEDKVIVSGEVYFPGEFVIRKGERLSDVILRAGGITPYGYIKNIVFRRKSVKEIQKKRLKELRDRLQAQLLTVSSKEIASSLSPEDIAAQKNLQANLQQIIENLSKIEPEGRVVIKVKSFEELKKGPYNFELEDGDEIIIPKRPSTVNVVGEVYNPTSFIYTKKNPTVEYYLNACGGLTDLASEKNIFVVRGDGSVISNKFIKKNYWWKDIYDVVLEPGDTVVVPRKLVFPNYMRDIKDITQILYQIATTVAVTKVMF